MKRILVAVAVLALVASVAMAQPGKGTGKGGPRGGGGMRGGSGISQEWATLCFEINLSAEQVAKLRPTFQWAWKAQNSAIQSAMASHSMESARKTMESVTKTVDERVKIVLTKTQQTQYAKYKADQAALRAKMRAQMGGGPGGKK